jgi:hypothetical protein
MPETKQAIAPRRARYVCLWSYRVPLHEKTTGSSYINDIAANTRINSFVVFNLIGHNTHC